MNGFEGLMRGTDLTVGVRARRAIGGVVIFLTVLAYLPLFPTLAASGLDPGWQLVQSIACERQLRFGSQLVFTWGPLGCWTTGQFGASDYVPSLILWACSAVVLVRLVVHAVPDPLRCGWVLVAFSLVGVLGDPGMALPLALLLHAHSVRAVTVGSLAAAAVLGVFALTKFTVFIYAFLALPLAAVMKSRSSVPVRLTEMLLFFAAAAFAWIALGRQAPQDVVPWLRAAIEVTAGYPQAMAADFENEPGLGTIWNSSMLLLLASTLLGGLLVVAWRIRRHGHVTVAWIVALALFTWIGLRYGSVRTDAAHLVQSFCTLFVVATLGGVTLRGLTLLFGLIAVIASGALLHDGNLPKRWDRASYLVRQSMWYDLWLPQNLARLDARWRQDVQAQRPDLPSGCSFEIMGHSQYLLAALPLNEWRPRPVFQGYSAYTPKLAAMNRDALISPSGPDCLVVDAETIDDRLFAQDDAALVPLLRENYVLLSETKTHLVLRRSAPKASLASPLVASVGVSERGRPVVLPRLAAGPVYAAIEVVVPAWQRLVGALWKPQILFLDVETTSGDTVSRKRYRLIPAIASAGFLLHPLINDLSDLRSWVSGDIPVVPEQRLRVVDVDGNPMSAHFSFQNKPFGYPSAFRP